MLKKSILIVLSLLLCAALAAASLPLLNLSELPAGGPAETDFHLPLEGKAIQVRGFWYALPSGGGVLTGSPQMKSCCLQAPSKIYQQVIVKGEISSHLFHRAITLEGIFKIEPRYNPERGVIQYYVLDHAREIQATHTWLWVWLLVGFAAVTVVYLKLRV